MHPAHGTPPSHWSPGEPAGLDLAGSRAFKTCNCTAQAFCDHFFPWPVGSTRYPACQPFSPIDTIFGGAGALLSIGALKRIVPKRMLECAFNGGLAAPAGPCSGMHSARLGSTSRALVSGRRVYQGRNSYNRARLFGAGSDCYLTQCLWRENIGHADPGWQLRHGEFLFDTYRSDASRLTGEIAAALAGSCDESCKERLVNVVSFHQNHAVTDPGIDHPHLHAQMLKFMVDMHESAVQAILWPS